MPPTVCNYSANNTASHPSSLGSSIFNCLQIIRRKKYGFQIHKTVKITSFKILLKITYTMYIF
jgi:hypothetical protein